MSTDLAVASPRPSLVKKFATKFSIDPTELTKILVATAFRQKDNATITNEQMTALMIVADQYGLNPFTKEIYAYPDKGAIVPVVSVDGWTRIINDHSQMDGIEFRYSEDTAKHKGKTVHAWIECAIRRKDRSQPIVVREFFEEVVRTPNFSTPWDTHPNRMHRHKTLIQCARVAFGFAGIYDEDEAERIIEKDITPQATVVAMPQSKSEKAEERKPVTIDQETGEIQRPVDPQAPPDTAPATPGMMKIIKAKMEAAGVTEEAFAEKRGYGLFQTPACDVNSILAWLTSEAK